MSSAVSTLDQILETKNNEVRARARQRSVAELQDALAQAAPARGFAHALRTRIAQGQAAVIAEIKRASPSKGLLRAHFVPADIARSYARAGASCLSVLTDECFFQGADADLVAARAAVPLPVLRKDFVISPYQLYEARVLGADAVLLIVAALGDTELKGLLVLARALGLDALVEVHDALELRRAVTAGADLIGINNRDLRTFETHMENTLTLAPEAPAGTLLVTESGIGTPQDVATLWGAGLRAFLVGEAFMRASDPGSALETLFRGYV
ncbi:MAG TPA: indole-3-glycerol phosphate synthase TrpC [Acidiferrobacteraceae bacterium]|nr:indole-3-glycerol phosphate synthase TrpC [Acidiferrobacteraceae bacterium]